MTIIQPNKNSFLFNAALCVLFLILGVLIWRGIILYNEVVDFNHNARLAELEVKKSEIANADLKNKLYDILSHAGLESLAVERGLVKEKKPYYFSAGSGLGSGGVLAKNDSWASVSQ